MSINDPCVVREEYASERGLEGRRAAYRYGDGPDAPELVFAAVAEVAPRRVLEVGPGTGELAALVVERLGADVVGVDSSPRMVELTRARGVDARLGDVQELPFGDGEFDCAVAAWMLYHVPDVDRALGELARVLRLGGRLVAATNRPEHLRELRKLLGLPGRLDTAFSGDRAAELLRRHFARVEERDAAGTLRFPDRAALVGYVEASRTLMQSGAEIPELEYPFVVSRRPVVFVADKAAA